MILSKLITKFHGELSLVYNVFRRSRPHAFKGGGGGAKAGKYIERRAKRKRERD
jgi:hypothetical protein